MSLPIDKEAIEEIKNPIYFCAECGAPLWNLDMVLSRRDAENRIGFMPKIKRGFYACLNHEVHKFKCDLYEHPILAKDLEWKAKQEEINEKSKKAYNEIIEAYNTLLEEFAKKKGE